MSGDAPVPEDDLRSPSSVRQRMRPAPVGGGWALVIVATVVVVVFGLGTWVGLAPLEVVLSEPSDHEVVHAVGERLRARWPQVPGPPARYVSEARSLQRAGDASGAARRLAMAIALEPDQVEALLLLSILDARGDAGGLLLAGESDALVVAVESTRPDAALLPAARAWRALVAGQPEQVSLDETIGREEDATEPELLWARLRASRALGLPEGEDARALLEAWPGHPEACEDGARAALRAGQLFEAERLAAPCTEGDSGPIARRVLADVLARTGRPAEARAAYADGGLMLHAARVAVAEGLPLSSGEQAALAGPGPAAAVQQVWAAMSAGDHELLAIAVERIPDGVSPELAVTRAAAALWSGDPATAGLALDRTAGPRAAVLRAQLPGASAVDVAAARTAWPALPGGGDPVATYLLLGASDHAIPARLLLEVGQAGGLPLSGRPAWVPADARARALLRWLDGGPLPQLPGSGAGGALDEALAVAGAVADGRDARGALARLRAVAPDLVMTDVLEARVAADAAGCLAALGRAAARMPGLAGLDRERYRCAVRSGPEPSR